MFTPQLFSSLAAKTGVSEAKARTGTSAATSSILDGLAGRARDPGAMDELSRLIDATPDVDDPTRAVDEDSPLRKTSSRLLSLATNDSPGLIKRLASSLGVGGTTAAGMIAAAAGIVLGGFKKYGRAHGVGDARTLANTLMEERAGLRNALPASSTTGNVWDPDRTHAERPIIHKRDNRWWWLLALIPVVLLGFWLINRRAADRETKGVPISLIPAPPATIETEPVEPRPEATTPPPMTETPAPPSATTEPGTTETPAPPSATTEPGATEPGTTETPAPPSATMEPGATEPGTTDTAPPSATTEPGASEPDPATPPSATTEPGASEPDPATPPSASTEPGTSEPGTTDTESEPLSEAPGAATTDPDGETTEPPATTEEQEPSASSEPPATTDDEPMIDTEPPVATDDTSATQLREHVEAGASDDWVTLDGVEFEPGQAEISDAGKQQLEEVAEILSDNPDVRIEIGGFTSAPGSARRNQMLSEQRAEAARKALIEQGVDESRVDAKGYGESEMSDGDTGEVSANRRIAVKIEAG